MFSWHQKPNQPSLKRADPRRDGTLDSYRPPSDCFASTASASTAMAESSGYNPLKHGTIDLRPDDDDDFGIKCYGQPVSKSKHTNTVMGRSTHSHSFTSGQSVATHRSAPAKQVAHSFYGSSKAADMNVDRPMKSPQTGHGFSNSPNHHFGRRINVFRTPVDHSCLLEALQNDSSSQPARNHKLQNKHHSVMHIPTVTGTKRKPTTEDRDETTTPLCDNGFSSNKRRPFDRNGGYYKLTSNVPTDVNTQHSTQVSFDRAPRPYNPGTSQPRRLMRSAATRLTSALGSKLSSFWSTSKPLTAPPQSSAITSKHRQLSLSFDNTEDTEIVMGDT